MVDTLFQTSLIHLGGSFGKQYTKKIHKPKL